MGKKKCKPDALIGKINFTMTLRVILFLRKGFYSKRFVLNHTILWKYMQKNTSEKVKEKNLLCYNIV